MRKTHKKCCNIKKNLQERTCRLLQKKNQKTTTKRMFNKNTYNSQKETKKKEKKKNTTQKRVYKTVNCIEGRVMEYSNNMIKKGNI